MRKVLSALAVALPFAAITTEHAAAQQISGNDLYTACQEVHDMVKLGFCVGYLIGATEGQSWGLFWF